MKGLFFGVLICIEIELVDVIIEWMVLVEKVCFVLIGIEVIMIVVCLVCGVIGCDVIVKFVGNYYGYFDVLFVVVGFGVVMVGLFGLVGVLVVLMVDIIVVDYNDVVVFDVVFFECGD